MLSIGEFSKICQVSAKTLRYYAEIGLLLPEEVNPESGYRYYAIAQLETMLFINRLKEYSFSLEEIKAILDDGTSNDEILCTMLLKKQLELEHQIKDMHHTLERMNEDISKIKQGNSIMSYLDQINVQLTEVPDMCLLSIRKMVHEQNCEQEYQICFPELLNRIAQDKLTMVAPPMVLFHSEEFKPSGLDMEFAIPVQEHVSGTRKFSPGLCLKTTLHGSYSNLSSVYTKQQEWAEKEGYENMGALFEVYVKDPSSIDGENDQVTEIYYPVKKKSRWISKFELKGKERQVKMKQEKLTKLEHLIKSEYGNTVGIAVFQNNHLLYENYFQGCTPNSRVHMYSVTKSIISMLIGIAIDKGYIKSIQERILDYFPEMKREKEDSIQNITIKDLLTMSVPYQFEEEPYEAYFTSDSYVETALSYLGGNGNIGEFRYAPIIGPDILSGILVKSTNRSVYDFAREYLFTPLGIQVEKSIVFQNAQEQFAFNQTTDISGWVMDKKGVNTAGWGLSLSVMDMAKLGQLYLNKGKWNNLQIVSADWVQESIIEHNRWKELNLPYGYLWWVFEDGFAAMGDGGNIIYINTKSNMVVSIASLFVPDAKDRIEFIQKHLIPALEN